MSYKTKEVQETRVIITSVVCDSCGESFGCGGEDCLERQEMLHWSNDCGYGSVFGDGTKISIDLCQSCVKARLGDCLCVNDVEYTND